MTSVADAYTERPGLACRKAIITGQTTGTGGAMAVLLAQSGMRIFLGGRSPDHLRGLPTLARRAVAQQLTMALHRQDKQ